MAVTSRNVCVFCLWEHVKQEVVNNQGTLEALRIELWNDILEIMEDTLHCML